MTTGTLIRPIRINPETIPRAELSYEPQVFALEGGPCGGKTSVLNYLVQTAVDRNLNLAIIPESATEIILELGRNGLDLADVMSSPDLRHDLHLRILKRSRMGLALAKSALSRGRVIVHDRPDISSYLSEDEMQRILEELELDTNPTFTDYDKVLYLPTIAHTSPELYESLRTSNSARHESAEQAQIQCDKNRQALVNHPGFELIEGPLDERCLQVARLIFGKNEAENVI